MTTDADFNPTAGAPLKLAPDLTLVLAPNPSPMTHLGTNTFILGHDKLAIIDPGPDMAAHLDALMRAINGRQVTHIFVTHSHKDHSPLAPALSQKTGAPICAFGDSFAGRSNTMLDLAARGYAGGGEGIDPTFDPTRILDDAEVVRAAWGTITAIHTPGHMGNHMCFVWRDSVFTGDHVMGWASSMVSPPDGDVRDFMASCRRLQDTPATTFYPAHGAPILNPSARLAWLIAHRETREAEVISQLHNGPATPIALTKLIYVAAPAELLPAAMRNVFAHLIDLAERGVVSHDGPLTEDTVFQLKTRSDSP